MSDKILGRDRATGASVEITDEELGKIIRSKITTQDLSNLFKPVDLAGNGHRLIQQGEDFLMPCDHVCSLAEVTPKLIIDNRG